jgi:hypothetical protein
MARRDRLEAHIEAALPEWSLAPVVGAAAWATFVLRLLKPRRSIGSAIITSQRAASLLAIFVADDGAVLTTLDK